jgi:hypothetical protein
MALEAASGLVASECHKFMQVGHRFVTAAGSEAITCFIAQSTLPPSPSVSLHLSHSQMLCTCKPRSDSDHLFPPPPIRIPARVSGYLFTPVLAIKSRSLRQQCAVRLLSALLPQSAVL